MPIPYVPHSGFAPHDFCMPKATFRHRLIENRWDRQLGDFPNLVYITPARFGWREARDFGRCAIMET